MKPGMFLAAFFCVIAACSAETHRVVSVSIAEGIEIEMVEATNGFFIGVVMGYMANIKGIALSVVSIVPHGIFELSAFFIASAMGFMLAESVYNEFCGRGDAAETAKGLGMKFVTVVIPLLFLAAYIESFITPLLMKAVM